MTNLPIVDTHVHLWEPANIEYPWLPQVPVLNRPYLLEDYRKTCGEANVTGMVFVECEANHDLGKQEADWVASLAEQDSRLQGIVARASIEKGKAIRDDVAALAENRLVKGIRRLIQEEPDVTFCAQPNFIEGVQTLEEFGLSFDICVYHPQLSSAIELVRQCPNINFVLDHIGKPGIKDQLFDPWKSEILELAELDNVTCKISGMVCEADMENWQPADLKPYIHHVLDAFGFDRVMFGGDWPVIVQACEVSRWIDVLSEEVSSCSESEQRRLFHDNAVRVYRLGD
ncbi:MAG: amidohydrolase family protein [Planctomycetota bacterium]